MSKTGSIKKPSTHFGIGIGDPWQDLDFGELGGTVTWNPDGDEVAVQDLLRNAIWLFQV